MLCHFAERARVRLASEEVNNAPHQLVPLLAIVLLEVVSDLHDMGIDALDAAVYVAFLGISNRAEFVLLFNYFGEVPELRWSAHILSLERVVHGLHVL